MLKAHCSFGIWRVKEELTHLGGKMMYIYWTEWLSFLNWLHCERDDNTLQPFPDFPFILSIAHKLLPFMWTCCHCMSLCICNWCIENQCDIFFCVTVMFCLSTHSSQFNFCPISTFPGILEIDSNEDDILGR